MDTSAPPPTPHGAGGRFATQPFAAPPLTLAQFSAHDRLRERQARLSGDETSRGNASHNSSHRADKWQLLRALAVARQRFGLSDRSIAVLEALCSFHQARELDGSAPIVVFPSNRELGLRARGMSAPTLRRHLAALVKAGLVLRRDSPNGKRFARRDGAGGIAEAFGFDLSPFALEAGAIFEAQEAEERQARAVAAMRCEITIHLRDVAGIVNAVAAERARSQESELDAVWAAFHDRLRVLSGRVGRHTPFADHEARRDALLRLRAEVEQAWLDAQSDDDLEEMSASDVDSERHIQNSNTDRNLEKGFEKKLKREANAEADRQGREDREGGPPEGRPLETKAWPPATNVPPSAKPGARLDRRPGGGPDAKLSLAYVLSVCPQIAEFEPMPPRDWRDLVRLADLARAMMGVSPDAWARAMAAMGPEQAAAVVAAMLERHDQIRSPGGYLRKLTARAEEGKFGVKAMLKALE